VWKASSTAREQRARKLSNGCVNARRNERSAGKFVLSRETLDDLDLIWGYIAKDNPEAADRVLETAYQTCKILADHPELGRLRKFAKRELAGIRSFVIGDFPNFVIFSEARPDGAEIVRVLHGARDIEKLFDA
jgi:toxin ParE1/3/4